MYGWSETQALAMNVQMRIPAELRYKEMDQLLQLSRSEVLEPYCTQRLSQNGAVLEVWITATALHDERGQMYAISTTERIKAVPA